MHRSLSVLCLGLIIASCSTVPKKMDLEDIGPSVSFGDRLPSRLEVVIAGDLRGLEASSDKAVLGKMYSNKIKRCDVLYRKGHFTFATASSTESDFVEPTRTSTPVSLEVSNSRFISDTALESPKGDGPVRKKLPVADAVVDAILGGLRAATDSAELAVVQDEDATRPSAGFDYLVVVKPDRELADKTMICGQVERRNEAGVKRTRTTGGGQMIFVPGFSVGGISKGGSGGFRTTHVPGQFITTGGGPRKTHSWTTPLNVAVTSHFEFGVEISVYDPDGNEVLSLAPNGVGRHRKGFGDYETAIDRALVVAIRKALEQVSTETAKGLHAWGAG